MGRAKDVQEAKMASRDKVGEARGLSESRPVISCPRAGSCFACRERDKVAENLAPLYREGRDQALDGPSKSVRDMNFVWIIMLSAQVQDVVARVEMVGQDLFLTTNGDDSQCLRRTTCRCSTCIQVCSSLGHGSPELHRTAL